MDRRSGMDRRNVVDRRSVIDRRNVMNRIGMMDKRSVVDKARVSVARFGVGAATAPTEHEYEGDEQRRADHTS